MEITSLLYADGLILCGEWEEDLRVMVGWFIGLCRRNGKNKVMARNEE